MLRDYLCLQIVYIWFGTQSLKHLALDFAVGKNGTRIREKVWCRRCRVCVFGLKSLGVHRLKCMIPRDLMDYYDKYLL